MIEWPASLPMPTRDYTLGVRNSAIRTQMESGRFRQRRRFTASENSIAVSWDLTDAQFQLFDSFVFDSLNGGSDWFGINLLTGGGVTLHKARFQNGNFSASPHGYMGWKVTATLDVELTNRIDVSVSVFLVETGMDEASSAELIGQLNILANQQLPNLIGG